MSIITPSMAISRQRLSQAPGVPGLGERDSDGVEQRPQRLLAQPGSGLGQSTGGRHRPLVRPGSSETEAVDEFPDDLFVAVVEQRQRQHEIHHDMSG
jgi:hypothetical protein